MNSNDSTTPQENFYNHFCCIAFLSLGRVDYHEVRY